ncbi:hypothetical protein SYNPS1DRAFT_28642 [Syncephalis pseudoplumigaleata]|uniref:Tyrosinase copper-binding domain-containing protein n=1 Tax=Syncephalis pseudoplumigaleata TaxID=1712513 RepID=A0A4P9Z2E4_9FUNG|nr:hypothetical protein SYNPS1DRAFT_28642 [Syncephalis pseudoplumigaleata]|eukprot:RKP25630.1 hypothetical protein SYNPS1DRAFT_28642 [Syncephalis pseudoplumigaleata]
MRLTSFILIAIVAVAAVQTEAAKLEPRQQRAPRCRSIRNRREIRTLSDAERNRFFAAVRAIQSGPRPTTYDRFVQTHYDNRLTAHGWPWFLPWHRALIREFERKLQEHDPTVMLPYWDWAYDSQAPEQSPVWHSTWLGGNGQPGDRCVTDGVFAQWQPFYPEPHCLRRDWAGGQNVIPALYSPEMLNALAQRSMTFTDFNRQTESPPHNAVHVSVGSDMGTMYSANDPIFWIHHAFVDKQWNDWQRLHPRNYHAYEGINSDGTPAVANDWLRPFPYRVADVFDTQNLCYMYAPFRVGTLFNGKNNGINNGTVSVPAPLPPTTPVNSSSMVLDALDRTEILGLRMPRPIPETWLRMNNANIPQVRQTEAFIRGIVANVNRVRTHVSPSVPVSQPEMLTNMINTAATNNGQLTATRKDRQMVIDAAALKGSSSSSSSSSNDQVTGMVQHMINSLQSQSEAVEDASYTEEDTLDSVIGAEAAKQLRDNYGL